MSEWVNEKVSHWVSVSEWFIGKCVRIKAYEQTYEKMRVQEWVTEYVMSD